MYSARKSAQAVALLFVSGFFTLPAHSQTVSFLNLETKSLRMASLTPSAKPASPVSSIAPCGSISPMPAGCTPAVDYVQLDLRTMGKPGQKILQARKRVLEILQADSACTEWYRTKDADPAATFRTLNFILEGKDDEYVREFSEPGGFIQIRNPYVARVVQAQGRNATVTLNSNGAFFAAMATVVEDQHEGGPVSTHGARGIRVGPYMGGTFQAQVASLLHEFGHVIDLLPVDHDDFQGKSQHNTEEVLRFCRAEIESRRAPGTFLTSR